jgi:uncharacterized protein
MRKLIHLVLVIGALYGGLCALLYMLQDAMLFPGGPSGPPPAHLIPDNVGIQRLTSDAGDDYCIAIGAPVHEPRGVLLWFLGNGESLFSGVQRAADFAEYGVLTVVTEYPGYGDSAGAPSLTSILSAAERSGKFGVELAQARQLEAFYVGGQSLGTFSAVHLASQGLGEKLLLVSPITSVLEAARSRFGWLPVGWLIKNPFDNVTPAEGLAMKTVVIHGLQDGIAPVDMGRRLSRLIPNCQLVEVSAAGHNDLDLRRGSELSRRALNAFFAGGATTD